MAHLKLKQVLSNMSYDSGSNQLTISGENNALIIWCEWCQFLFNFI